MTKEICEIDKTIENDNTENEMKIKWRTAVSLKALVSTLVTLL